MQNHELGRYSDKMCDKVLPKIHKIPHDMLKKASPGVYSPWSYDIHIYHDLFCNLIAAGKNKFLKCQMLKYQRVPISDAVKMITVAFNLFVASKNETTNSPIHEFKVLHEGQRTF